MVVFQKQWCETGIICVTERQKWRPGEKEELARLYAEGLDIDDVLASRFGRTGRNLRTVLHDIGAPKRQNRMVAKDFAKIAKLVSKGLTHSQITAKTGWARSTVKRACALMCLRKYKRYGAGEDGWPVGLHPKSLNILKVLEANRLITLERLHELAGCGVKELNSRIGRLLEKKLVKKRERLSGPPAYDLSGMVKNMRREFFAAQNSKSGENNGGKRVDGKAENQRQKTGQGAQMA